MRQITRGRIAIKMLSYIAIFVTYFIEMLIAYVFFLQIGERKHNLLKCFLIGISAFSIGAAGDIIFNSTVWINAVSFVLIHIIFGYFCFDIKITKLAFYSIIMDIFSAATEIVSIFIISAVTDTEITEYISNLNFFIIDVAISKAIYFITCLILSALVKKEKSNMKIPVSLYFYPTVVVLTLIMMWVICASYNLSNMHQILMSAVSVLLFFSTVMLFIVYQQSIDRENRCLILENEIRKEKTDKNYYRILEYQNKELMIYAHDTKNHLDAIKALNDNKQIDEYLTKMTDQLNLHTSMCRSGNRTLDVIINKYVTECEMKHISIETDVARANLKAVDDYDLVTVLGNILDNAVESAAKSKEKFISLTTKKVNTYETAIIVNSCDAPPKTSGGNLKTTKSDAHRHGLGMKSVMKVIERYDGDLDWEYDSENKRFITTVILK